MSLSPQSRLHLPPPTATSDGGATEISDLHPDILLTHILNRLDGPTLASASCASSTINTISTANHHSLWSDLCHSTWPSTTSPIIRHLISTFPPHGTRSFFSSSYSTALNLRRPSSSSPTLQQFISAVDIHYKDELIFTKIQETETLTGWFKCSPFRVDLLDPKNVVVTSIHHPDDDVTCMELSNNLTLSWILIDPIGRRAVNLSSHKPVSVHRHWLSREVQVQYASILAVDHGETVKCGIVIACGGSEAGEMQVREVCLQVENMDGMHLNGKESLVILKGALEGKKGRRGKTGEEGRKRYEEYLEMKVERRERKLRRERRLDMLCVAIGVSILASFFSMLIFCI